MCLALDAQARDKSDGSAYGLQMRRRVTIRQVAEAAGVARSSVSRAFTRPELLNAATVEKIMKISTELGYTPSYTARALSTGRHGNIALVIPDVANPFFPPMIRAAQNTADGRDYCVFLGDSNEDARQEERLIGRFLTQIEGLIIASSRLSDENLLAFAQQSRLVLVNRVVEGLPQVLIDSSTGIAEAVDALHAGGHRHLAYVNGPSTSWSNNIRRTAVETAAKRLGVQVTCLPPIFSGWQAGEAAATAVLSTGATAVIAFDDLMAHGLQVGLRAKGVEAPRDISLIGCDDVLGNVTTPPLSSISSPTAQAGQLAANILCDLLEDKDAEIHHRLPTRFVPRATHGPAPKR